MSPEAGGVGSSKPDPVGSNPGVVVGTVNLMVQLQHL